MATEAGESAAAAAAAAAGESAAAAAATTPAVMVVGIDESEHSFYALEWTLSHFFSGAGAVYPYRLVVVHAKPTATSVVGLAGPAEVLPFVESDLKRSAVRVIEKAQELCKSVSDVVYEVVEGDARNVLCEAVEKHHADVLAVGSHGYGAIKRAVLGSVSDYCAHHAHCTVMIVKKPKHKAKTKH
ncbi:universal stress protein PHOS34 isoform X2 [Ananas comosus]|uniref:Universal stress protein PHOS34 isoform X2 n=1 Tax=Ananas comosus TaxID=4615 RepID=A0A6P5HG83_ANACO|nr:universal stress protein PHOS34 isoform X2 [Ananas comosus]